MCGLWLRRTDLVFICNACLRSREVLYVMTRVLRKHLLFGWHQTNVKAFIWLWSMYFSSLCYFFFCHSFVRSIQYSYSGCAKLFSFSVFSLVFPLFLHFLFLTHTLNYPSPQTQHFSPRLLFLSLSFNFAPLPSACPFVSSIIFLFVCLFVSPFICLLYLKSFHFLRRGLICLWLMVSFLLQLLALLESQIITYNNNITIPFSQSH